MVNPVLLFEMYGGNHRLPVTRINKPLVEYIHFSTVYVSEMNPQTLMLVIV